jgi:DNA-binding GntR family transcriptional regulator
VLAAAEKLDAAYNQFARPRSYNSERHARIERMHLAFHMLIAEAAGVPVLTDAIERSRVLWFNAIFNVSSELNRLPERWHRDLAAALCSRPPDEAAEAMRVHVRYRQEEVIDKFSQMAEAQTRMVRGPQRNKS